MKIIEVQLDVEHARRSAEISGYKILVVCRSRKTSMYLFPWHRTHRKKLEAIAAIQTDKCYYISRESQTTRNVSWSRASLYVCLSVCLSAAACPHYCTDPDVTRGIGRGYPLVVHYWADLQSVHGLRCYGNITRTVVTSLPSSLIQPYLCLKGTLNSNQPTNQQPYLHLVYDNIVRTRNVGECSVLALCLVINSDGRKSPEDAIQSIQNRGRQTTPLKC